MGYGRITATGENLIFLRRATISIWIIPFHMDRSFDQYCDLSRQFDPSPSPAILPDGTVVPPYTGPPVETFIEAFGRLDLLTYSEGYHSLLPCMPNLIFFAQ